MVLQVTNVTISIPAAYGMRGMPMDYVKKLHVQYQNLEKLAGLPALTEYVGDAHVRKGDPLDSDETEVTRIINYFDVNDSFLVTDYSEKHGWEVARGNFTLEDLTDL